jgi:Winged helix DNA-binding domain
VPDDLTLRQLNRATLARQLLLARERVAPVDAIERLGGLQAQEPKPAFAALWTRLEGFRREQLHDALTERTVVRGTMMRATLHMASAGDYAALRTTLQPMLTGAMDGILRQRGDVDVDRVLPVARALLDERPRTFNDLRADLSERFPEFEHRALGYAVRMQLPLLMVPSEDRWSFPSDACFALADRWIEEPLAGDDLPALVRRHLAAFGPASAADIQAWSGVGAMKTVLDGMRDALVVFADERGRELFDLPDAPLPDPETSAPVRFLPEYDNIGLSHADRTRVIPEELRFLAFPGSGGIPGSVMVDGFLRATWRLAGDGDHATLTVTPLRKRLSAADRQEVTDEGAALLTFLVPDADATQIRISAPA